MCSPTLRRISVGANRFVPQATLLFCAGLFSLLLPAAQSRAQSQATPVPSATAVTTPLPTPLQATVEPATATAAPLATIALLPSPTAGVDGRIVYEVVSGDTLSSIAVRFDITLESLFALNDLNDVSVITIGQEIILGYTNDATRVAAAPYVPPGATLRDDGAYVHVVITGDSLIAIAAAYGLTLPEVLDLNEGLAAESLLTLGQEIVVGTRPQPRSSGGSTDMPTGLASPTSPPPEPASALAAATPTVSATPAAGLIVEAAAAPTLRPLPTAPPGSTQAGGSAGSGLGPVATGVIIALAAGGLLAYLLGRRR
jgi:LysM repeat protein